MYICNVQKTKSINRFTLNIKNKRIMAATNWTIIKREKKTRQIEMYDLDKKWTYKTALGIATELNNSEIYELICVVETQKILTKK